MFNYKKVVIQNNKTVEPTGLYFVYIIPDSPELLSNKPILMLEKSVIVFSFYEYKNQTLQYIMFKFCFS